jgi:hypothetical protein
LSARSAPSASSRSSSPLDGRRDLQHLGGRRRATALLASMTGVFADCAGGVAPGGLVNAESSTGAVAQGDGSCSSSPAQA